MPGDGGFDAPVGRSPDPCYAVTTWRCLRLATVGVLAALGTSVVVELLKVTGHCLQTSISSYYYYTPARAVFVGALVTLGVCMICLQTWPTTWSHCWSCRGRSGQLRPRRPQRCRPGAVRLRRRRGGGERP
jgi:hypothetical protein